MRSTSAIISFAIISAAAPAFAAPVSHPLNVRVDAPAGEAAAVAAKVANPLLKEFGKSALVTGAFTGLSGIVDHFLKGGSSSAAAPTATASSKRQLTEEDIEILKRSLGSIIGDGALGLAKSAGLSAGVAGLEDIAESFFDGSSSSAAAPTATASSKRQLTEEDIEILKRSLGSIIGDGALGLAKTAGLSAGVAGLEDIAESFFDGSSSSAAVPAATPAPSRRELVSDDELVTRAIAGLLDELAVKRGVDKRTLISTIGSGLSTAVKDVFEGGLKAATKKGIVAGLGGGVGAGVLGAAFANNTRRGLEEPGVTVSLD